MTKIKIYDKVSWHYPEGHNCPSLKAAKSHFIAIMNWLKEKELLSQEGEEIFELGIDSDFSITSSMLNQKGNDVIIECYYDWLKLIDYTTEANFDFLNESLTDR